MTRTKSQSPPPRRPQTKTARRSSHPRQLRAHGSPSAGGRLFRPTRPQHPKRHLVAVVVGRERASRRVSHQIPPVSSRASPARLPTQTSPSLPQVQRRVNEVAPRKTSSRRRASSPRLAFNQVLSRPTSRTRTRSLLPRMPSPTRLPWTSTRRRPQSRSLFASERALRRQHLHQRKSQRSIYNSLNPLLHPGSPSRPQPQTRTGSKRRCQTSLILLEMISGEPSRTLCSTPASSRSRRWTQSWRSPWTSC